MELPPLGISLPRGGGLPGTACFRGRTHALSEPISSAVNSSTAATPKGSLTPSSVPKTSVSHFKENGKSLILLTYRFDMQMLSNPF